jgi:hypothetical protein
MVGTAQAPLPTYGFDFQTATRRSLNVVPALSRDPYRVISPSEDTVRRLARNNGACGYGSRLKAGTAVWDAPSLRASGKQSIEQQRKCGLLRSQWQARMREVIRDSCIKARAAYRFFHPPRCPGAPPLERGVGPNSGPDWRESVGWKILLAPGSMSSREGLRGLVRSGR